MVMEGMVMEGKILVQGSTAGRVMVVLAYTTQVVVPI